MTLTSINTVALKLRAPNHANFTRAAKLRGVESPIPNSIKIQSCLILKK